MIVKVWNDKNWIEPELKEVEGIEKVILLLEMINKNPLINPLINPPINPPIYLTMELSETQQKIIEILIKNDSIKIDEIADVLNLKSNTIKKNIKQLKDLKIIERIGTTRKGKWIVKSDK